jgi:hypothetical protein
MIEVTQIPPMLFNRFSNAKGADPHAGTKHREAPSPKHTGRAQVSAPQSFGDEKFAVSVPPSRDKYTRVLPVSKRMDNKILRQFMAIPLTYGHRPPKTAG